MMLTIPRRLRHAVVLAVAGLAAATGIVAVALASSPAAPASAAPAGVSNVNPIRVPINGHPANSGFLAFVEGNVALNADESEGTIAAGGTLSFNATYNVAAHRPVFDTFTAPGDAGPTYLYAGAVAWSGTNILRVQQNGYTKIADASSFTAHVTDRNGASVAYRVVPPGRDYDAQPRIEGTARTQTVASVSRPVPSSLLDIGAAFTAYRSITTELAACTANAALTDPNGGTTPVPQPYAPGARGRLTLTPHVTNVVQMSTADLANLSEITFVNQPAADTPLVINVTGSAFVGDIPNLAGIGGNRAPFILWNFPQASSIVVTGGASIAGSIYAPNAALNWRPTQNIEGNVIAASFTHGPVVRLPGHVRELHDFPFSTTVSCSGPASTGTLALVKNVDNTGGGTAAPSAWTLTAVGPSTLSGAGGTPATTVPAGDYELSESGGVTEYVPGDWSCTGGALAGTTVSVPAGGSVVCQITNRFNPPPPPPSGSTLTLIKHVVNDGGGQAVPSDWTLTASTSGYAISGPSGTPAVTAAPVSAGDYSLSEVGSPLDYTAGPWSCDAPMPNPTTVTIAPGIDVSCQLTNSYDPSPAPPAASLTLIKHVDNTGRGTATPADWTLAASGPGASVSGPGGSDLIENVVVPTGHYDLTESGGPGGYRPGAWSCTGGSLSEHTVALVSNAAVTCSITNTFQHEGGSSPGDEGADGSRPTPVASPGPSGAPGSGSHAGSELGASGGLANTGSDVVPVAALGMATLALGGLLIAAAAWRRRRAQR